MERTINNKMLSAMPSVEEINGNMYGVTNLVVREPLAPVELSALKDYIASQMSDGFGNSFQEREIKTQDGGLYISFWSDDNYFIDTQQELNQRLAMEPEQRLVEGSMNLMELS